VEPYPKVERSATKGTNGRGLVALIVLTFAWADADGETPSMLSNSGLSLRIIDFQLADCSATRGHGEPGEGGSEGVYLRTISVQRWKTASVICIFQFTARRKAISFWLIPKVFSPEILLQALLHFTTLSETFPHKQIQDHLISKKCFPSPILS